MSAFPGRQRAYFAASGRPPSRPRTTQVSVRPPPEEEGEDKENAEVVAGTHSIEVLVEDSHEGTLTHVFVVA